MKIIDCFWELVNLGERTCEVSLEDDEFLDASVIKEIDEQYSYQVVKIPVGNVACLLQLQEIGYSLIETQVDWIKKINEFNVNHPLLSRLSPNVDFIDVKSEKEFDKLLSYIDDDMFSTDRIACDPHYGYSVGRKRYCNWMSTEFQNKSARFAYINYDGKDVGFFMLRINNQKGHGALAGIFKCYHDMGIGLLSPASMPLYIIRNNLGIKSYFTSTSSNNAVNTRLYSTLGFQIKSMHYVLIKHV